MINQFSAVVEEVLRSFAEVKVAILQSKKHSITKLCKKYKIIMSKMYKSKSRIAPFKSVIIEYYNIGFITKAEM